MDISLTIIRAIVYLVILCVRCFRLRRKNKNLKNRLPTKKAQNACRAVVPETSRTLIVLFLTYSSELSLKSGSTVQSERVFLLFSIKLVLFSSNFFDLGANFFGIRPFLDFWERFRDPRVFSCKKWAHSALWREGLSFPRLALRNLHFFLLKMLITATTAVTFLVFVVSFAISSAFVATLRAVLTALIGRGLCDK